MSYQSNSVLSTQNLSDIPLEGRLFRLLSVYDTSLDHVQDVRWPFVSILLYSTLAVTKAALWAVTQTSLGQNLTVHRNVMLFILSFSTVLCTWCTLADLTLASSVHGAKKKKNNKKNPACTV